jgi:hypothetical protein
VRDAKDFLKNALMILLGLCVLIVAVPLALKVVGIVFVSLITLAVLLIKVAVVLAFGYLLLVGVRALLR